MHKYFTWDSTLFTIVALGFIIIGSPIWLMIFAVLTMIFLIAKSGLGNKPKKADENGIWGTFFYTMLFGFIFGVQIFGFFVIGLILFGFWAYILGKYLSR